MDGVITIEGRSQGGRNGCVGRLDRVRVRAQGHRGIRMAKAIGDGADVVAVGDRHRGRPVSKVVQAPPCVNLGKISSSAPPRADSLRGSLAPLRPPRSRDRTRANSLRSSSRRRQRRRIERHDSRFAVFVGSSRRVGLVRCKVSRITAMLESMVRRPSLRSSQRSAASSERLAPVTAAKRRAIGACGSIWWSPTAPRALASNRP